MIELTPRMLNIPHAVAARYARPGTDAHEELVGEGNLALVEAARTYDPARGAAPESWLTTNVRWRVWEAVRGPRTAERTPCPGYPAYARGLRPGRPPDAVEVADTLDAVRRRVAGVEWSYLWRRFADGETRDVLARDGGRGRWPGSRANVQRYEARLLGRLRARLLGAGVAGDFLP